jgi:hypothetical protein
VLAFLASAEKQTAIPADIGFAADIAAANFCGNGGTAGLKRNQIVELYSVGDLQPVFAEGAQVGVGFVGKNDVAYFKNGSTAGPACREILGGGADLRIVAALALTFKRLGVEAVNGQNNLVDIPITYLFGVKRRNNVPLV